MLNRKPIADLMVLMVLISFLGSVSVLTISGSSKTMFLGAVCASPAFPIEGAIVTASGPEGYGSAWTDSSGQYSITEGLMTGNYTVTASAEGYLDATIEDVAVTEGVVTSNINFLLDISGAISGKITEVGTGSPLQYVIVTAESSAGGGISESSYTDASGDYLINTNLVTGTYNLTATYATGHITNYTIGIAVTAGIETKNVNLALEKSGIITGTVTDSGSSAPLADISIIVSSGGASGGYAVTNSSGKYRVDTNLATGTYNVSALFPEGHISKEISGIVVTAGSETTADLSLDPSGIISGTVTAASNGQPVAEATVATFSGDFTYFGSAETDATGYYRIASGLGTQTYTVMASFGMAFNTTLGVNVVAGSETSNVNMELDITPSGVISGRVTNTTSGSPIEGAFVSAEGPAGSGDAYTDSNGDYSISTGLETGTYTVNASAFGYSTVSLTDVNVVVDQVTSDIDFQLQTAPSGTISGTVSAEFNPIPEYANTFLIIMFAAAIASVTFRKLRATRRKTLTTLARTPAS